MPSDNPPANYLQVLSCLRAQSKSVQDYFSLFPDMVADWPWEVSVGYVFNRVERAKHSTIYCGAVKIHNVDSAMTKRIVDSEYMSRKQFLGLFKTVFGKSISEDLAQKLQHSEMVRDKIVHGKAGWTDPEVRKALVDIFKFAEEFNTFVMENGGFPPFSDLRGFRGGSRSPLSKSTTKWVLRGMGFGTASSTV